MCERDSNEVLPVAAAKAGEREAWDRLIRRFQLPLFSYVCEVTGRESTALDLVQESFLHAMKHINQLRENDRFGSWLFRIAHQKCRQFGRRCTRETNRHQKYGEMLETIAGRSRALDPSQELAGKEWRDALFDQLARLSEEHRSVLLLHWIEEFSLDEISVITGVPVGTVKSRIHYAKQIMKEFLTQTAL